ncbi:hypothetical protein JCM19000A_18270 [Silvimonas sp. JCM 19000]
MISTQALQTRSDYRAQTQVDFAPPSVSVAQPVSILLVEDSPALQQSVQESCEELGDRVLVAVVASAAEAINALEGVHFDLAIIDIELREGTGFDVLDYLRTRNSSLAPPVRIMLTNHGEAAYRKKAARLGADYYFDKSLQFEPAIDTITEQIRRHANPA